MRMRIPEQPYREADAERSAGQKEMPPGPVQDGGQKLIQEKDGSEEQPQLDRAGDELRPHALSEQQHRWRKGRQRQENQEVNDDQSKDSGGVGVDALQQEPAPLAHVLESGV